ncbi:MAG: wax ester/triacylglycerol synthase family O-acyltransferase [Solirubrobacteraceae bacterium]|nr:wax ester/triacylglycerol synthase family O-acyltransferase [Solirubrobacteraceae bacterium]
MVRILKPMDAVWLLNERGDTPAHVGCLIECTPPPDAGPGFLLDVVARWRKRTTFVEPFNLRPRMVPLPRWEVVPDDEIDLDYHLRHSALPRPGSQRELGVLVSRLHSHPLDRNRPLWECHVIEGLADGRFAVYFKVHHSQLDGVAGLRAIGRTLTADPDAVDHPPIWADRHRAERAAADRDRGAQGAPAGGDGGSAVARAPRRGVERIRRVGGSTRAVTRLLGDQVREVARPRDPGRAVPFRTPTTVFNGGIHAPRRYATQHLPMDRMRTMAKAAGVTVNDLFLTLCGSALRRYLTEIDALPDRDLVAALPVSVRDAADQGGGNAITFIHGRLGVDVADPCERLQAVSASTRIAKDLLAPVPSSAMDTYTLFLMGPYISQLAVGLGAHVKPMHNLVVSNVPGPPEQRYLDGATVDCIFPLSLLFDGQALNVTAVSYAGTFCIGFTGCRDSLPSMQRLAVYWGEAADDLEQGLGLTAREAEAVA